MSIAVFSNFVNGIPATIFDGKDVSMVLLVDPPVELPAFFLANKGVLDTASKTIKVYDGTGNTVIHDFDIAGTDLTPITEAVAELETRVGDNETDIATLQGDVSGNASDIATNTSDIGNLQGRAAALETTTGKHTTDILALQGSTGTNASDISALTIRVGDNETDIAAVVLTANNADTLSKANKERLDNLPAPPSLEGYIKTGDDATLNSVSFGDNTKIDTQPDLGLVLQGDYIYGKADSGYEHFFVESGNFNVKSKKIQKVNDGQAVDDAVNLRQLNAVESKADTAQTTANAADTLSKNNQTAIGNLSTTVGDNTSGISTNAKDIGDLSTKVNGVETTANAADSLSKDNKTRLDNLPPIPSLENYVQKDSDATLNTLEVQDKLSFKTGNGGEINFSDILKFNNGGFTKMAIVNSTIDVHVPISMDSNRIINLASGEDGDNNAANIGDVKRIAVESGGGLKPVDSTWDMLGYPVLNIGTSDVVTSAATVGQVNAVDSKADINAGAISNLSTTVGQHDTQIGTNTSDIAAVTTTANAADVLSKDNKTRLDNLPPSPDLDGYVKNGEDVNFGIAEINTLKVTKGDDSTKFSDILIDGNTNTQMNFVGDTHFYVRDRADNTKGLEAFQIDSSARFVAKQKIKTPVITNLGSGTTNSNSDKAGFIDLSVDGEVKLGAKSKVKFNVGGNEIMEAAVSGLKLMRDVDANSHTISHMGDLIFNSGYQIEGASTGNLKIRNANGLYKNTTTDNNSIHFDSDDLKYKATHHMFFKNQSTDQIFGISDSGANLFNHSLLHVKHIIGESTGTMDVSGVRTLKRNNAENTKQAVIFNAGDITSHSDKHEWQTNDGARRLTIENHKADWHDCIVGNVKDAVADKDVPNLAQVNALIAASGGGGVEYENYITRSQDGSKTFYETTEAERNAWVVVTNNNAGALTYTFDYSRSGQEVVAGIENKTKRTIIARMQLRQSTVLTVEVPAYSVFSTRYVPDIGHYVYNIGGWYPTEQRVITLDEINPQISSDYKQMTKNIIAAMPNHTTLIGYHNPDINGASKYKFVTTGKTGTGKEGTKCAVVIHKHTSGHATGLSTTEGSSGRVYSRVLDGTSGIWNTNDTSASFALQEDIPLDSIPEDQIFFTGDNGVLESYIVNEETDEVGLRPLTGYNIPKHDSDIAALEIQTEKNRSVTHYFINEGSLSYDWVDSERRPLVEVQVLNTMQTINNSSVTVTDNDTHLYSGTYNSVGAVDINSSGNWSVQYVYHNAYKKTDQDWYVVFNQGNASWQIIEAANPHTSVGEKAASVTVQLGGQSSLPESFGAYTIDPNFDNIDSLEFLSCETGVTYDDINSRVLINFNGAKPSGYVVLK